MQGGRLWDADELFSAELIERLDAFRRPARFQQFMLACEADARGRKGLEQRHYPHPEFLARAREVAVAATLSEAERAGLQGFEIARRLHDKRLRALKHFKEQWAAEQSNAPAAPATNKND